ncbi:MAG TPA: Ig-like domain-containing protein [Thermoanaerobaculia bacterium]|nr:Ig-like domain-containing protein [Thermoanaerobaculia bacterium]
MTLLALTLPAMADDVTISGNVNFSSLDGSSLDHDGAANGTFTVDDGDLTVLGTINCNDASTTSACAMNFAVSGDFTMQPGSAIYAENRSGGGAGGNVSFTVGGNVVLSGSTATLPGAVISSSNHDTSSGSAGGNITFTIGGAATVGSGAIVTAGAKGGNGGAIALTAEGLVTVNGLVASGPSSTLAPTRYTDAILTGGSATPSGGNITITSHSHAEPAVTVGTNGVIVSQSGSGTSGTVALEGCGLVVNGLVASVSVSGPAAKIVLRSGTSITVDGRDLNGLGSRKGMLRADALQQSAASYSANLFAREAVTVYGPASGALYAITSNGGATSKDASGSINLISTTGTVTASGNAFAATNSDAGDQGGSVNVAAAGNVNLDTAKIDASGDDNSGNNDRAGGSISVRSHSGSVSWQNGLGDVRPTGTSSGVTLAKQGTITIRYCTTYNANGSSFPANGTPNAPWPNVAQSCSPAAPSLPVGEVHPDCNDAPIVANDAYTVAEGGTLNVPAPGVLANDVDPDGDPFTAVLVTGPAHASSFSLNADGSFTYVHNGGETSSDSFTYQATDGSATSTVATVLITVSPVNDAPVASNDAYSVNEGGTINFAAPGVLANDSDSDGPSMSAVLVSGPANASSFVLNPNGSFTYVHNGGETTSDSFTYQVSDGFLTSNVAMVSITIAPVNDAPVANNDAYSVNEGDTLNGASVLANDTDPDSSLTAVLVSGPANASSFVLNANGTFTYVHNGSETTSDSFTYKANDGTADSNVATVTITVNSVNDAPVAAADSYSVDEGATLSVAAPGVLGNDADADNVTLSAVLVSGPSHATTFTLNPNGSFSYTHNGSETASDSFTYKANDGSADSNTVTVTIAINPVNDAPVANDDSASVNEGGTLNGTSVLANDTDAENDSLTATLVSGPANASSFTLNADGTYTYVHNGSETATDSFTYKANDGSLDSNVATVTITINAVNDAPVAVADSHSVNEGGTLTVPAPGVLGNDTDAEFDTLTAVLVSGPSSAASFSLNANGGFTYVHNGSETTTDSFTYKANDGTDDSNVVTVTITINAVNDAPVAVADSYSANEGGTLNASSVLANDTDAENDALTAILVSGPSNAASFTLNADGTFTYVHNGGESTSDSFTYKANDGSLDSNTVTVTIAVNAVNDAPVAVADGPYNATAGVQLNVPAPGVLANDSDVDNSSLTAVLVSGPSNATFFVLNADGSFSYTSNTVGSDSFTYKANDGTADSNVVTVVINVISQPPVANDDAFTAVGNTELRVGTGASATPHVAISGSVLANDTDPDTAAGSLVVVSYDATSANGGTVTMNPNGTFTYIPPVLISAPDSFNYVVSDGVNSDTGTVHITFTGRVWYVRNNAAAGDGRSHLPFNTLASAVSLAQMNDTIYVHAGNGTMTGHTPISLQDGQRLIGQGVPLVVGPYTLHPAGARPTIDAVTLANGNEVAGVNITSAGAGINGDMAVSGAIREVGITGGTDGIVLTNTDGSFALTNVTVAPGGVGVSVTGTANIAFNNVAVTTAGNTGIVGTGTGTLTFTGGSVTTANATAVALSNHTLGGAGLTAVSASNAVDGISLTNTLGTFAVAGTGAAGSGGTITGMTGRGVNATNAAGVSLASMNITGSGLQGVLFSNTLATPSSLTIGSSSVSGSFSNAVQAANSGSGSMAVKVANSTFSNNAAAVVVQTTTTGALDVDVTGNVTTFNTSTPFIVTRSAGSTAAVDATISNNTVGTNGVANSGAVCGGGCGAIAVTALGGGVFNALIDHNVIYAIDGIAIRARSGQGSGSLNATITNNDISQPVAGALNGINVQSGALSADTNATCATITGNTVTGGFGTDIRVINNGTSAGTTFSLPGYAGLGTDLTAVANFLKANNTITTASAARKTSAPQNQFSGGAPCATPAP